MNKYQRNRNQRSRRWRKKRDAEKRMAAIKNRAENDRQKTFDLSATTTKEQSLSAQLIYAALHGTKAKQHSKPYQNVVQRQQER